MDEIKTTDSAKHQELETEEPIVFDEQWHRISRRLVRKLDCTLMPIIWVLYMFNYLDRNNLASAKLNDLEKDLGLKGDEFNTAVAILNVGYMIVQIPSNMILTHIRPSLWLPLWALIWSCISASTAAAHNYNSLIAIRLCLGIAEAPFFPGVFFLLSSWYTRTELGLRVAILYSGLVVATAFSGLIASGVFAGLDGAMGLSGWRWLYIIEGSLSFFFGLIALFLLPDFPESDSGSQRWLLTAEERQVALQRIETDRIRQESNRSVWYGLKLAIVDYRTWGFVFLLLCNHAAYGFAYFYPTIVRGLGLGSETISLVLTAPPYLISALTSFALAWSSDRRSERSTHIIPPMCLAIAGFIISVATINSPARYAASFLYVVGCYGANGLAYSWAAGVLNQTPEKRAAATAIVNVLAQLGTIMSPYFFRPQDQPRYVLALILLIVFAGMSVATSAVLRWDLRRSNRRIEEQSEVSGRAGKLFLT